MPFKLSRRKKNKKLGSNSDRIHDTPKSKAGSTQSVPSYSYNDESTGAHGTDSPLFRMSRSLRRTSDAGNKTEPNIMRNRGNNMNGMNGMDSTIDGDFLNVNDDQMYNYREGRSPVMPEITSIKSQRNSAEKSIFKIRSRSKHSDTISNNSNSCDSDGHSYSDQIRHARPFDSNEKAFLSLPLLTTKTLPHDSASPPQSGVSQSTSRISLPLNEPIAESSPNSRARADKNSLDIETPTDVEAHMAKTDSTLKPASESNGTGIISSFISAAHNAASHIGTITSSRLPDEFKSHPPATTDESLNNEGPSFLQHLDSLLFVQNKKQSREASVEVNGSNNDNDDRASTTSKPQSFAHDIVFQPVRKTAISTLGKGELTLEALGFTEAAVNSEKNSMYQNLTNQVPQISVDGPQSDPQRLASHGSLDGKSRELVIDNGTKVPQVSKASSRPGSLIRTNDDTMESKRSISPVSHFRRSLSPTLGKLPKSTSTVPTQETLGATSTSGLNGGVKKAHRRSFSSGTAAEQSGFNTMISTQTTESTSFTNETPAAKNISLVDMKGFPFANSKRDIDFHSMFKKIPKDERLLEDYSCALQKDILVQGKMYITLQHICFSANILGWTTSIIIPLQEIVQLEKKTIAGLFPNGIVIQTLHQKYIFASFLARDSTFDLITNTWNKLVRGPNGNIDMQVDLNDDFSQTDLGSDFDNSEGYISSDDYDTDMDDEEEDDFDVNGDDSATVIGPMRHPPTEPEREEVQGETKLKQDTIDAPLGKVFQLLFGDDTSNFKKVLEAQKNREVSVVPKFSKDGYLPKREYQYIKPLNSAVGPKETLCKVVETLNYKDLKSYVLVTQQTKTPDVPSGNSFTVQTQIYLSWGAKNSTNITVYSSIQWTAKSWIKGAIEKGAIDGQKESISILVDQLKTQFAESDNSDSGDEHKPVSSLPTVGPSTHEPTDNEYKKVNGDTVVLEETFNIPLGTLYCILFGDDSSYYKTILEAQKNFDITTIPSFTKEGSLKKRQYSYTKPLNGPIGPKQTRCNITETIEFFDVNKYILASQVTASPDVPSGNSFTVCTKFYFSWGSKNTTKLFVVTSINWTGKSWIKGPIEKGTIEGQNESMKILVSEIKKILSKASSNGGKKGKKVRGKGRADTSLSANSDKASSESNKPEQKTGIIGVLNTFQAPYSFALMIVLVIFIYFVGRLFTSSDTQSFSIDGAHKVMIGGKEYMIMPSIENSFNSEKLKQESEYEIWKWINERSKSETQMSNESNDINHKEQDISEMVRLAEHHLEVLKKHIEKGDAPTIT